MNSKLPQAWVALYRRLTKTDRLPVVPDAGRAAPVSETHPQQFAEFLPQLVWSCDPEGNIDYLSRQWEQYTGHAVEAHLGRGWEAFIHPDDLPRILEEWRPYQESGEEFSTELRIRRKDGSYHWFDTRTAPLRDNRGRIIKWFGACTDIEERKRAQELLLRAQKMEALGTLAGGIAHDFNNILLAIRGNTKLAFEDLPPNSAARESLVEIDKASARAADLVRRILAFSRQEEPKCELLQLPAVVEEALSLLRPTLPTTTVLRSEFAADVAPVIADVTQIHQILMNLATNSAHAIGERPGRITVELDTVQADADLVRATPGLRETRYTRLSVIDDGSGMDQMTRERIFDPFFTTKAPGQGTGLGLSVVDGIVKTHGGVVTVESELGEGTTIRLYFPAAAASPQQQPARSSAPLIEGQGRILYVDDDEALVFLASRALKRLGYEVIGCDNPVAALRQFRAQPRDFDAVVSDLSMPMLHGFDLARELLAIRPDLPVVVTSGYIRQEDQHKATDIGVAALILKPNTIEELGTTLDRLFRKPRSRDSAAPVV